MQMGKENILRDAIVRSFTARAFMKLQHFHSRTSAISSSFLAGCAIEAETVRVRYFRFWCSRLARFILESFLCPGDIRSRFVSWLVVQLCVVVRIYRRYCHGRLSAAAWFVACVCNSWRGCKLFSNSELRTALFFAATGNAVLVDGLCDSLFLGRLVGGLIVRRTWYTQSTITG